MVPLSTIDHHFSADNGMSWSLVNSASLYDEGRTRLELIGFRKGPDITSPAVPFDSTGPQHGQAYIPERPNGYTVFVAGHTRRKNYIDDHWRRAPGTAGA